MITKRIAMLGAPAVGKTSIISTLITGQVPKEYVPTRHEIYQHQMTVQGVLFNVRILDIPALTEYSSIPRCLENSIDGYILCYDATNRYSFEQIQLIRQRLELLNYNHPCILVATKVDVIENREVTKNEGYNLSKEWCSPFIECSAYTGHNIEQTVKHLIFEMEKENELLKSENVNDENDNKNNNKKESFCCIM